MLMVQLAQKWQVLCAKVLDFNMEEAYLILDLYTQIFDFLNWSTFSIALIVMEMRLLCLIANLEHGDLSKYLKSE